MLDANTDRSINAIGMVIVGALFLGFALLFFGKGSDSMFTAMVGGAEGHAIEYDLDGGKGDFNRIVIDYEDNEYMIPHKEPTRDSYIFNGWNNSADNQTHYPGSTIVVEEDIVLTAQWKASSHDVRYNLNGGQGNIPNLKVPFDEEFRVTDTVPTKEGQHLVGWESDVDGVVYDANDVVDIKGPTTFTAVWNQNTYGVTHDLAGGTSSTPYETVNIKHNKHYTIPTHEPTRTGYVFHGWEDSVTGETFDVGHSFKVTDNTVLKAKWSSDSYRLRYDLNGGRYSSNQPELTHYAGYGDTHRTINVKPERTGFEFVGWKNSRTNDIHVAGAGFSVQGDTELVAEWKAIDFRVTFDLNNGTGSFPTQNKGHNETIKLPSNKPTRYGYQFNGWLSNVDNKTYQANESFSVRDHTTLKAQWLKDRFEVIYDLNGGSGMFTNGSVLYESDYRLPNHTPSKSGARFTGWLNSQDSKIYQPADVINVSGVTTLTAQWSINDYTVTYDLNGGSGTFLATGVSHGAKHAIYNHTPTRTGYDFVGWKVNNEGTTYKQGATVTVTSDIDLVAQWERKDYSINYNLNGGQGSHATEQAKFEDTYTVHSEVPTRDGYTFKGWVDQSRNEVYQPNETITVRNNMNLVAQWDSDTYDVIYALNGGDGSSAFSEIYEVAYGRNYKIIGDKPTRTGHRFTGWLDESNNKTYNPGDTIQVNSNTTLEAQWTLGDYTVEFDLNGGVVDNQSAFNAVTNKHNYTFEINSQVPELPGESQIEFLGWKDTSQGDGFVYGPGEQYTIIEDTTLVAEWGYGSYLVIYDENGGQITYPDNITQNEYLVDTKDGHTVIHHPTPPSSELVFAGWESDVDGERYFEGDTYIPSRKTQLTAQWELREYTLKYNLVGGSGSFPDTALKHNVPLEVNPQSPTKRGYIFKGWVTYPVNTIKDVKDTSDIYHPRDFITATKDTTLYAVWEPEVVRVRYTFIDEMTNKGSFPDFVEVDYGSYLTLPTATPLATGSTFLGWLPESSWSEAMYSPGQRVLIDDSIVDFRNMTVLIDSQWELNKHTLTYNLNGGSGSFSRVDNINYGSSVRIPNVVPTKQGYSFAGWKRSSNGSVVNKSASIIITGDETLTAQWNRKITKPTVSYDTNGGSTYGYGLSIPSRKEVEPGTRYSIDAPNMVKNGSSFIGWENSVTGDIYKPSSPTSGDVYISFTMPNEPVVLKAIFSAPEESFEYIDKGSFIEITDYDASHSKDVIIPTHIKGKPVEQLSSFSFNYRGLTSVYIPDTVRTIGNQAFAFNDITDLRLSNNLLVIEGDVFSGNKLKSVYIPDSVHTIRYNAFADNPLTSVSLPKGVEIGYNGIPNIEALDPDYR